MIPEIDFRREDRPVPSRREFLASSAALAAGLVTTQAVDADAVFARTFVFDALSADENWRDPEPIFAAYKASGLRAIHASLNYGSFATATADLRAWQTRFDQWPERIVKVTTGRQFAGLKKDGPLGVVLGFQNTTILGGTLANLDTLYASGTRCIQLTYNEKNQVGCGCLVPEDTGVTVFGRDVVAKMNELGVVVDLSHCGDVTSKDGISISKRPAAFTHTVCKSIYNHVRGKSDALIKAMSDKGGMTGIATLGYFVGPTPETSLEDYLKHIDYAVKIGGIDHIGVSSDYSIRGIGAIHTRESWLTPRLTAFPAEYRVRWPPWIQELDGPDRFINITRGLAKRGYSSAQIEKLMGSNWLRFFSEAI